MANCINNKELVGKFILAVRRSLVYALGLRRKQPGSLGRQTEKKEKEPTSAEAEAEAAVATQQMLTSTLNKLVASLTSPTSLPN